MVAEMFKTEEMMKSEREWVKDAGMAGEEKASKQARMVIQPKCRAPKRNHQRDTERQGDWGDDHSTVQSGTPSLARQICSNKNMNDLQLHQVEPLLVVKQRI